MTGQEISSDFIIADLFASLKSDHMPAAPVEVDPHAVGRRACASGPFSSPAARTMSFASRAAPAWITAVWRSGEIDAGATVLTAGSRSSLSATACERVTGTRDRTRSCPARGRRPSGRMPRCP